MPHWFAEVTHANYKIKSFRSKGIYKEKDLITS